MSETLWVRLTEVAEVAKRGGDGLLACVLHGETGGYEEWSWAHMERVGRGLFVASHSVAPTEHLAVGGGQTTWHVPSLLVLSGTGGKKPSMTERRKMLATYQASSEPEFNLL